MYKARLLYFGAVFSISTLFTEAQGVHLLTNQSGVSLSYDIEFYKSCEEMKANLYKVTAYFANNSGKTVVVTGASIDHGMTYYPKPHCNAPLVIPFATFSMPNLDFSWENNSVLQRIYYIQVPMGQNPPKPGWSMPGFKFIETPKAQQQATPQWSAWINDECFKKIKYRYMGKELMNLNYQYHYYFQATNNYTETIYFVLSLKDATGKERFGTRRSILPGKTIDFVEKMDQDYIKEMAVEKVCFKVDNSKYLPCDEQRGIKTAPAVLNKAEILADAKKSVEQYCRQCVLEDQHIKLALKDNLTAYEQKKMEELEKQIMIMSNEGELIDQKILEKYNINTNEAGRHLYDKYWAAEYKKCSIKCPN